MLSGLFHVRRIGVQAMDQERLRGAQGRGQTTVAASDMHNQSACFAGRLEDRFGQILNRRCDAHSRKHQRRAHQKCGRKDVQARR
jgi:hypothetical protein